MAMTFQTHLDDQKEHLDREIRETLAILADCKNDLDYYKEPNDNRCDYFESELVRRTAGFESQLTYYIIERCRAEV